ncbi:immunity 49 family protein [Streptomyces sp. NPDC001678]|uniref:immunity 49 family protein n=1 Tax=Streptomyces sp. NPDC001678 TaxID=3364599 RepID=UPI00367A8877
MSREANEGEARYVGERHREAVTESRHDFPAGEAERRVEGLDEFVGSMIDSIEMSSSSFNLALDTSLTAAYTRCAVDPKAEMFPTWDAFVSAMQVGSALFVAATTTEQTVECLIAHKKRTVQAVGPTYFTDAGNWITAFWLAVICREQDRMTELAKVPPSLLRESGEYDEYIYAWIDTLQTWWLQSGDIGEKLVAAMEGTDPAVVRIADQELMLKVLYPPINLFYRYAIRDQEAFNAELLQALRWHKEYWTANQDRTVSAEGLVALGPLAVACLAYDAGFPIQVESEYLPEGLLDRGWLGEFDT